MTQPTWSALAATAIARLQRIAAEYDIGSRPDRPDWSDLETGETPDRSLSPAQTLAELSPGLPMSIDEQQARILDEIGNDADTTGMTSPEAPGSAVRPPADGLLLALRLCALFGSAAAVAEMIRPGAVMVIEHGDVAEVELRRILKQALLPEGLTPTVDWDLRPPGSGTLCTLSLGSVDAYRRGRPEIDLPKLLGLNRPVLILLRSAGDLPDAFRRILPRALVLPPPDADILMQLLAVTHPGTLDGSPAMRQEFPGSGALARVDGTALLLALREPTARAVVARLRAMLETAPNQARPSLDSIEGYGAAEAMARRMVADLQAWRAGDVSWSEVQRSVLFFGAPGTGKSFLAQAMAGSADISLVRGGLAQWQAAGHLGQMLAAMRQTFAEARRAAPAVLVIDEIDAVGSRSARDNHNENYRRQVINAFLEELDGLARMPGVLVVGTCNHPDTIDPAVLRPGRFDSKIEVPPPGRKAIARMLRDGLVTTGLTPDAAGMARLIRAASGQSAAAIEAALRAARASARAGHRAMQRDDLLAALGARAADPDVERRIALHECGHAIVATALGIGRVTRLVLTPEGGEAWTMRTTHAGLLGNWEAELTRTMAGRAAERLALGDVSAGAGGNSASDLGQGTMLALQIDTHLGLGAEGPLWRGTEPVLYLSVPANAARIRQRLDDAEDRAAALLARNRPLLDAMGAALLEAGLLEEDELHRWLEKVAPAG